MAQERFADPALLILTSLTAGDLHGYAIMEDAKTQFGVQMGPGTLYATLARLEERGLIELVSDSVDAGQASTAATHRNQRRPYRLTEKGEAVLREELGRLSRLTQVAFGRLGKAATAQCPPV